MEKDDNLPIDVAFNVSESLDVDQVIVLVRDRDTGRVRQASYGKTFVDSGMAAMDAIKIAAMLQASPTSLDDAVEAAGTVRPGDIKAETTVKKNPDNVGVHAAHCCELHGCKYADENCPVETGKIQQNYLCEICTMQGMRSIADLNTMKTINQKVDGAYDGRLIEPTARILGTSAITFCKFVVEMRMQDNLRRSEKEAIAGLLCIDGIDIISPEFVEAIADADL